jgi:hypothetical protein
MNPGGSMKTNSALKSWLALVALISLTVYILACGTSFSPDDSKVLYTTVDPKSGVTAIAMYDRGSGTSRTVFEPMLVSGERSDEKAMILRPQWLPDGRSVVAAFVPGGENGLVLAVCPLDGDKPVRLILIPEIAESLKKLQVSLPLADHFLFLGGADEIVRIDVETGDRRVVPGLPDIRFFGIQKRDAIVYTATADSPESLVDIGVMNPATFSRKPLFRIPEDDLKEDACFTLAGDGSKLAITCRDTNDAYVCRILQKDANDRRLSAGLTNETFMLGNGMFSPDGKVLYFAYASKLESETNTTYGVVELPVDGRAPRRTPLVQCAREDGLGFFQASLSNDGKTIAVASTYLSADNSISAPDCALFLVDLVSPERKITRVPVPLLPGNKSTRFN